MEEANSLAARLRKSKYDHYANMLQLNDELEQLGVVEFYDPDVSDDYDVCLTLMLDYEEELTKEQVRGILALGFELIETPIGDYDDSFLD